MCGITGVIRSRGERPLENIVSRMTDTLFHRGPDDFGVWADESLGIAFGHRRLSIIDLSKEGRQPMSSSDGSYVIVYNGEIYNFLELRKNLEDAGHVFRGHSDTEVVLAAIVEHGIEAALNQFNGMFAFGLWDRKEKDLYLVRDRLGKKPLYFGWVGRAFVFGSELKAFRAFPGFSNEIDRRSLSLYLRHNCIPAPYSIYQGIYKLPPGTSLRLSLDRAAKASSYEDIAEQIKPFWSTRQVYETGLFDKYTNSPQYLEEQLDKLLRYAVSSRMISDVPLGAFLSGGIDSSLVVALMQAQSERPVKTFTIGFQEAAHNEAEDARRVADCLGTDHNELYLSPQDVLDVVPKLPILYDEPFSDSSQIPTYLVSRFAREYVTVALSGDGGDELFGGYNRYTWAPDIWHKMSRWPLSIRGCVAALLEGIHPRVWPRLLALLNINYRTPADKILKLAGVLRAANPCDMYKILVTHWDHPDKVVINGSEPDTLLNDSAKVFEQFGFIKGMMFLDQVTYLPDDILVKVDRASMGVGLEARAPLLDYRVAEFAAKLPLDLKIREKQGKYLLRKVLSRYMPNELFERPKMGFEMPIGEWLRGPLQGWAESLLSETRLKSDGYFNPVLIRERWRQHIAGKRNWQFHLWDILMFQAWLETREGTK